MEVNDKTQYLNIVKLLSVKYLNVSCNCIKSSVSVIAAAPMISQYSNTRNKRSSAGLKDACFRYRTAAEGEGEGYTLQKVFIEQIRASN